jgi:hypothetical protein
MHDIDSLSTAAAERLRALPDEKLEPYGWEEFRRRRSLLARGAMRRRSAPALLLRTAAAVLLLAGVTGLAAWMRGGSPGPGPGHPALESGATASQMAGAGALAGAAAGAAAAAAAAKTDGGSELADARTLAMERWLARQPPEPAMVRVGAYASVVGLEDRIAQLDDLLTTARAEGVGSAGLSPLEEQRSRLVSSLAQVRYAETLVAESPP